MNQADDRCLLREYLLGTLPAEQHETVRKRLDADGGFRQLLEGERAALARLDALPEVQPPPDLKERTLERIRPARPSRWQRPLIEAAVAVGLVIVIAAILLPALVPARESARRSSSANNLKQMGLVFEMYANEQRHLLFPPVTPVPDMWMCDLQTIYPEYLTDAAILVDPSSAHMTVDDMQQIMNKHPLDWNAFTRAAAESYVYLGWVAKDDADVKALAQAREKMSPAQLSQDIQLTGRILPRIENGIERLYSKDPSDPREMVRAQTEIVVMFERQDHNGRGKNVLYLDGHVAFVRKGTFPCTDAVDQALGLR
jgi:prepilin-type processing-associated H-X9-DG protein